MKLEYFDGRSSSEKIAPTGHSGRHKLQSMQSSGLIAKKLALS
jgi:hypothetical protein